MRLVINRGMSYPQTADSVRKPFTRKDLEDACRKLYHPNDAPSAKNRRKRQLSKSITNHDSDVGSQIKVLDAGVKFSAKKLNECKSAADRLEEELKQKSNEIIELERESSALAEMISGKNPEATRISELQKKIEEVNTETERKLHYRLCLRHMQQRIQKNSITLDAHMSDLSDALKAAEKDSLKSRRMMNDIESALAKASRDLNSTILEVETEEAHRGQVLSSKRNEATNAEKMKEWRLERESQTKEMNASFVHGKNCESIETNKGILEDLQHELNKLNTIMKERSNELTKLDETFNQVRECTGVNTLTDLVSKIRYQEDERRNLALEKENVHKKLQGAKTALESTSQTYSELRADGLGDTPHPRSTIKTIGQSILNVKMEGKMIKSTNARLEKVLVEIRQGGIGLYQRLRPYHSSLLEGEVPSLSGNLNATPFQAAHDTLEMLRTSEQILTKMLDVVGGPRVFRYGSNDVDTTTPTGPSVENSVNLQENNCRVEATKNMDSPRSEHDDDNDSFSSSKQDDNANQILTRVAIKRSRYVRTDASI